MSDKEKDICQTCERYWVDFRVTPEKVYIPCCDELNDRRRSIVNMDEAVPYPCLKCPFNSYSKKKG